MNLKQLEAFVKIANNKSFSKTARELFLTQPTVSAYISSLENEFGEKLFLRTTRGVELSESGKKIYLYAREIVELADRIEKTFSEKPKNGISQIVISASSIPATYLLPGIIAHFNRMYPDVEFRINETDSAGVVRDISGHCADIGFAGTVIGTKGVSFTPFYKDELVLITPVRDIYKERSRHPEDLSWIRNETWILRGTGSGTQKEAEKVLKTLGISTDSLQTAATFCSTGAILLSVKEGAGIAVISKLAAQGAKERGDILTIPVTKNGSYRQINMVTSSVRPLSGEVRKLMNYVKEAF